MIIERCDRPACKKEFPTENLTKDVNLRTVNGASPDGTYAIYNRICQSCWDELYTWMTGKTVTRIR